MALETFPTEDMYLPDVGGVTEEMKPKVNTAGFGDGYVQRGPDGINSIEDSAQLRWSTLPRVNAVFLIDFFRRHKGSVAFYWTPPELNAVQGKYIANTFNRGFSHVNHRQVTATFLKVNDV